MLSPDEIKDGMTFILQLATAAGGRVQWVETLRGDIAKRWYEIYRQSDWSALGAGDLLDHRFHERAGCLDQMRPHLFEQVAPLFGRERLHQMLLRRRQHALETDHDQIIE